MNSFRGVSQKFCGASHIRSGRAAGYLTARGCWWIFVAIILCPGRTEAQSVAKYLGQIEVGLGIQSIEVNRDDLDTSAGQTGPALMTDSRNCFAFNVGWNFPIVHPTDNSAIGVSPGLGLLFGGQSKPVLPDGLVNLDVPLMITFKYGTDARYYDRTKFGAAIGAGIDYGLSATLSPDLISYSLPIAMGEVSVAAGVTIIKLRFVTALSTSTMHDHFSFFQQGGYLVLLF